MDWDEYVTWILVRVRLAGYSQLVIASWHEVLTKQRFDHKHMLCIEMMLLNREEGDAADIPF